MTTVTVANSNNRLDDAEATTNWTKITAATAQEPDFVYQGTYSVSGKVGTSQAGHYLTPGGGSVDMTTGDNQVCLFKAIWTNSGVLDTTPSAEHRIGSGTGAYYSYYVADDGTQGDIDYPTRGGWLISPINPNVVPWRDATTGSPTLGSANYFATLGKFTGSSKSENVATDAVDLGDGLWIYGGGGADPDATWQDFVDADEGSPTSGRFGHVSTQEGILYIYGTFTFGQDTGATAQALVFTDSLRTIVFPGGRVDNGWNLLYIDLNSGSTAIDWSNIVYRGQGRSALKRWFDTEFEVDGTNEELDITAHGYSTGDAVIYSDEGGSETIGLTDGNTYYVEVITADSISIHTSRQNAYTSATPVGLTASSSGNAEQHKLTRTPNTMPQLDAWDAGGTSGTFDATGCTFLGFYYFFINIACTITNCNFVGCWYMDNDLGGGGSFDGCTFQQALLLPGEAQLYTADTGDITDCTFLAGDDGGSAIYITDNTGSPFTLDGCQFTGYGPAGKTFNAQDTGSGGDVDGTNDEIDITAHGFSTGDPIYYSDEGGTAIGGLTDQRLYWLRAVTANSISLHPTKYCAENNQNKIGLTGGSDETHAIYSANAAIVNGSGGAITINVSNGNTPSIRNTSGSSTTVVASVNVTITSLVNGTEVRVFDAGDNSDIAGTESVTGNQFQFSDEAGNTVHIHFIKEDYVFIRLDSYVIPSQATEFPVVQQFDRNYRNP